MPSLGGKIAHLQVHHPTWEVLSSQLAKSAKAEAEFDLFEATRVVLGIDEDAGELAKRHRERIRARCRRILSHLLIWNRRPVDQS